MPPKTAIFGKGGLIGSHLFDYYQSFYPDLLGTDRTAFDLRNPQLSFSLEGYKWAIIAAGFATPQRCLSNPDLVEAIDVRGMRTVVHALQKRDVTPILFSTAYVYDGKEECYYPDTPTTPLNAYGQLHADREKELGGCLFLRLGRVYGEDCRSIVGSLVTQIAQGGYIEAAEDQILQLVHVEDVIQAISSLQRQNARGIHHLCPEEGVSRYELALYIARRLGCPERIKSIRMQRLDNISRPRKVNLVSSHLIRPWTEGVERVVDRYRREGTLEQTTR